MTNPGWAIVTGGARNIGAAIAGRLRADGFKVGVLDIVEPADYDIADEAWQVDLGDAASANAALSEIVRTRDICCLVNNVGIVRPAPVDAVDIADFDRLMHVNLRASILCTQAVLPAMRKRGGGRIVMNTSRVTLGKRDRTLYSASKGAAQSMARTWAIELAPDGITVNCVAPGPIATSAFWKNNPPSSKRTKEFVAGIPVGRMGEPEDVANAVSFFCDARSGFVTGQTLFVCGGVTVG